MIEINWIYIEEVYGCKYIIFDTASNGRNWILNIIIKNI